ncbi:MULTISPECIES: BrnT family toxin [Paraburkholderia]|uniref:BrnT family toxin n=1 Tax=Paraburkholderia TaxID=1822464 RepID=UPI00225AF181|nr:MULTISPECIES: BrnT family toxin [Paraburkholderia]MCX4159491.1 BrnT family toxin [Paraburkholderia aspalathi]MDN7168890.1 BrnT family toxin [Paraburkholderia sp. SECH2]MDQ6397377.1 BrnT family toxin [Paraburkholderia aspalathi]
MRFEWDELKNQINIRKHGIDFRDAVDVFDHPVLTAIDQREDYGEERWIALGWMAAIVGVVVYVERNADVIRIISVRKATKHEVKRYKYSVWN